MLDYIYVSDAEREATQQYEGIYTFDEIELNKKLRDACRHSKFDLVEIAKLLKAGADPLGGYNHSGWDLVEHIYGDAVLFYSDITDSIDLPQITELFLKYGMNIDTPRIPYREDFSTNPMWHFAHLGNENAIVALKMLLDNKLSAKSFACFWEHVLEDFFILDWDAGDPQNDPAWNYKYTWLFKMMLLGASYDHIILLDEDLGHFICMDYNSYDIHNFRNWNNYDYFFDTSHCKYRPHIFGSIIHIYEKTTGKEVWKLGVGSEGRKFLEDTKE